VGIADRRTTGDMAVVKEVLPGGDRAIIDGNSGDELVVRLAPALVREGVRAGETLLVDRRSHIAWAIVPREEVSQLVLEEIPDIDYTKIGGLSAQIEQVRDAVELPFLHRDIFLRYGLAAPKGILLYGPPGTGKTMIAKAVAASLAQRVAAETQGTATSFFLNVKGPELLNKYVGETERQIRIIFQRARERANEGHPVIVFFDEMDSLFRTRGTGVSSDVENTIVPQLLAEIDGVEGLENVIIIGASNREDMIDPAILRPGRLDVKIKLDRPDAAAAREIFAKYLTVDTPLAPDEIERCHGDRQMVVAELIDDVVEFSYATQPRTEFLEVTYVSGATQVLYFKDFMSGAMIANIVNRAKKAAIKREIEGQTPGISRELLRQASVSEFAENEDLPNTANPDDWARISGKRGERITYIRTLIGASSPASSLHQ
ncbi:MAG: proteasome ATPase, partial [Propionibacteriaceae bacterium]